MWGWLSREQFAYSAQWFVEDTLLVRIFMCKFYFYLLLAANMNDLDVRVR